MPTVTLANIDGVRSELVNSKYYLNIRSGYMAPVTLHCSYGDTNQVITFYLFDGTEKLDLDAASVTVHGTRIDGANFGPFTCTTSGNSVSFTLQSSMTAVEGSAIAEFTINKSGTVVGTCNFGILVENAVFPNGVAYDSDPSVYQDILKYVQGLESSIKEDYITRITEEASLRDQADQANATAINTQKTRIDTYLSSGTAATDSELVDIRNGYDGTAYVSAGTAVREQITDVHKEHNVITEKTKNLLSINSHDYISPYITPTPVTISYENDDLTVTVKSAGTYRYAFQTVSVGTATQLTVSYESYTGTGQPGIRVGTNTGSAINWLTNATENSLTVSVAGYNNVIVAFYASVANNASAGVYVKYHKMQIEKANASTGYITPVSAVDISLRDRFDNLTSTIFGNVFNYQFNINGYINYTNGNYSNYGSGTFMCTDYIPVHTNGVFKGYFRSSASVDGVAFYDENYSYISGVQVFTLGDFPSLPDGTKYIRASNTTSYTSTPYITETVNGIQNTIVINCYGDSTTQGMGLNGAYYANYGESPYPARLKTLLVDNGYNNVIVNNFGHGGERTGEICARAGAYPCYITEDIVVSGDAVTRTSLGTAVVTAGVVSGTKVRIADGETQNDDSYIAFTAWSHDTNPVLIDGNIYNLTWMNDNMSLVKVNADGINTTIPQGSLLLTNTNKCGAVSLIYMGINDSTSLSIEKWVDRCHAIANMNGGKYIVIGCTHGIWVNWASPTGTNEERYAKYKRICNKEFGVHFIDMYDEFSRHAMDYALSAGYYSTKTESEITTMRTKLSNHIIPQEMSYDGQSENNVHLSEEGYHVMAMIIFERLKRLNYI